MTRDEATHTLLHDWLARVRTVVLMPLQVQTTDSSRSNDSESGVGAIRVNREPLLTQQALDYEDSYFDGN